MRSATARALSLGLLLAAGCKPDPFRPDAGPHDAFDPPWWTPAPGEVVDWDIQLARMPFDVAATNRAMYMIDLFDAVPAATVLDYGDGAPVTVPAGPGTHATAITQLHATTPRTFVVCHVNTGSIRLGDPDAIKYPGYQASPPDGPANPDPGSVIGWSVSSTDPSERYIDINPGARSKVLPLIEKRFDLAKQIGCDAIAADRNGALTTGFAEITPAVYESWGSDLTTRAHDRELSIGLWNSPQQGIDVDAQAYDWAIIERCGEREQCDMQRPFLNQRKAVFAIEYTIDEDGNPNTSAVVCGRLTTAMITGGIIKTAALDSSSYMRCP